MDRDASIYVDHMLEAITNIEMDTAGYDFEKFRQDRRVRRQPRRQPGWQSSVRRVASDCSARAQEVRVLQGQTSFAEPGPV